LCGGKVAKQQTTGPLQLLNNCGVMALVTNGKKGCHFYRAFACGLLDPVSGRTAAEALSNIVWALSKTAGRNFFRQTGCGLVKRRRDARLYAAVESCSNFAIEWGSIFQQERLPFDETEIPE
jgi:phosphoribosylformylglycinamidine synthase